MEKTLARTFLVFSTKGGVGKTTIAANLAAAFRLLGKDVCAVDAHFFAPDLGISFGILKPLKNLQDVGKVASRVESNLIRHLSSGVYLLLSSAQREIDWRYMGRILRRLLQLFDVVVVDMPPWTGKPLKFLKKSGLKSLKWILVVNPDIPSVVEARRSLEHLSKEDVVVVVNRYFKGKGLKIEEIEALLGRKVNFVLPESKNIQRSFEFGVPLVILEPDDIFSKRIMQLASLLLGEEDKREKKGGISLFSLLRKIFLWWTR